MRNFLGTWAGRLRPYAEGPQCRKRSMGLVLIPTKPPPEKHRILVLFKFSCSSRVIISTLTLPFCHLELKAEKPKPCGYPKFLKTFGDHIRKKRMDSGLLQKDVARVIGVEETSIYNWENNRSNPGSRFIAGIVNFLEYCPYLCGSFTKTLKN